MSTHKFYRQPWLWVPSLYFAEGLPYVLVINVSSVFLKHIGISNADITFYTSVLYLPWMVKPLWSPVVDIVSTKRRWILSMQALITATLLLLSVFIATGAAFWSLLSLLAFIAFFSATHDIAADGFYMLGLTEKHQAAFVGVRSMLYRIAMIVGQGAFLVLAGRFQAVLGNEGGWAVAFFIAAGVMLALALYHTIFLPFPIHDSASLQSLKQPLKEFFRTFSEFFSKKDIVLVVLFLFLFRFAEALLVKVVPLFLIDAPEKGGLGLTTEEVGFVYGTVGVLALIAGGLIGGYVVAQKGLRWWLWPMTLMMHVPDIVYVYLSSLHTPSLTIVTLALASEQFGYGFGFTAYALYMIYVSEGTHKTSHFALCTGIMALSMIVPGMISGTLQELLGYHTFFLFVLLATIPAFLVTAFLRLPENFGRNEK